MCAISDAVPVPDRPVTVGRFLRSYRLAAHALTGLILVNSVYSVNQLLKYLFLREPRSLAHRAHQSKSRLRRLEAVPPVHHVDNLRATVLEHRLAHAHQRLDVPRRGPGRDDHHVSFLQPVRQPLLQGPRRVHHGDLCGVRLMRLVQRAALRIQVVEAHGDAGALEGEGNLVGDQGLANAALLIAYQNRLHTITSLYI